MQKLFKDLDSSLFIDNTIILDIDGTLVPDGTDTIDDHVLAKINELKIRNKIFLLSNKKIHDRNQALAAKTGVAYVDTLLKKPNPKILQSISYEVGKPLIVMGDKWLTDGKFAHNIGAEFVKVKRIVGHEALHIRLINLLDDMVYLVHNLFS